MSTPYDGKILMVNWMGAKTPGKTIAETAQLIRDKMPNVTGLLLKTGNGTKWQAEISDGGRKAITGLPRIQEWVDEFGRHGLEIHVWAVPRGKRPADTPRSPDLEAEAEKFVSAANVPGVKSLLLDVEQGESYWRGSIDDVGKLMGLIRAGVGAGTHIGMILDGRRNRSFADTVDPWIPFIDSLHPMVYPVLFGKFQTIEQHLAEAFKNLGGYNKPIVPMLQAFGEAGRRPTPEQITEQGNAAWKQGAAGISFFRLGSDAWQDDGQPHMGEAEYAAVARIPRPKQPDHVEPDVVTGPTYTWQDVINAAVTVAARTNGNWDNWFGQAGVWKVFKKELRPKPYSGPPIEQWPLAAEQRQQILELLTLDSKTLIKVTTEAQEKQEQTKPKEEQISQPKRTRSIVGIHGAPGIAVPRAGTWDTWIHFLKEMGVRWYKQLDNGDPNDLGDQTVFAWAKRLKREGIEPIIRYYVGEQFPDSLPDGHFEKMRRYAAEGIVWAEIGNEPNLNYEWRSEWQNNEQRQPVSHTNPEAIRGVAETWVRDARRALEMGVRPAFYAFAPTDWRNAHHPQYSSVFFTQKVVAYLAQHRRAETLDIFRRGGWIAVHAATYEQPCDFDIRQPDGTTWDMALRSYEVVLNAFRHSFGSDLDVDDLVVMSTEGGVFTPDSTSMKHRDRLPNNEAHAERVVEMFRWLKDNSPLQAMCPWCISVGDAIGHFNEDFKADGWIEEVGGQLRPRAVYEAMRQLRFD
jgi:hypothetical protein